MLKWQIMWGTSWTSWCLRQLPLGWSHLVTWTLLFGAVQDCDRYDLQLRALRVRPHWSSDIHITIIHHHGIRSWVCSWPVIQHWHWIWRSFTGSPANPSLFLFDARAYTAKEVNVIHCNAAIAVCARGDGLWPHALDFLRTMMNLQLFLGFNMTLHSYRTQTLKHPIFLQ